MTTIFLSYGRGDDEAFVRRLYDDLCANGFEVWFDCLWMPSRQLPFPQEIRDAIWARDRLLLVIGPKAISSDYVTQEWKNALEMGKCVNPIVRLNGQRAGGTVDGYALIPDELKLIHAEDFRDDSCYAERLANLVRQLSDPAPPLGKLVAVPTLPLHYIAQRNRLLDLRDALLNDLQEPVVITGAAARVGVEGMGGIGKSVLAAALVRDQVVRRAFPDGIFWVGVEQQPNLVDLQRGLAKWLGDEAHFNDLQMGKQKLNELLAERAALLVLDNVGKNTDINAFDVAGSRCKLLLTTRNSGLVNTMAGTGYKVELPSEGEAIALLANASRMHVESLPIANNIVAECGRLPLALALCGGMAQAGTPWHDLLDALRKHELEFLADEHALEEQHRNLWRAMEVSVRGLPEDTQQRFAELSVFPPGAKVPERAVVVLWGHTGGLSERHVRNLLVELKQRSLVQLDQYAGAVEVTPANVSLHDLLHDFATRLAMRIFGSLAVLHDQLLAAYRKQCPNGWTSGPNDGYFFQHLRDHLIEVGRNDELISLLLDLKWLEAKTRHGLVFSLPLDLREVSRVARANHPQRCFLSLIEEALRRDIRFIARHREDYPQALFQCLWNYCWWYDCPEAAHHYETCEGPWSKPGPKLYKLLEAWRATREKYSSSLWIRSMLPPSVHLGTAQSAVLWGHEDSVTRVVISTDGRSIVSGSVDGTVRVWDAENGEELFCLRGHEKSVTSTVISTDGRSIVSGSEDGTVRVWDFKTGEELHCLLGHEGEVWEVAISIDARTVVSGSSDNTVRVWDTGSGEELFCLRGHEDSVRSIVISPDGHRIVSGSSDNTVRVWDAENGEELQCLRGHEAWVTKVAISTDGGTIASASFDDTVRVWDLEDGKERCLLRHGSFVVSVTISTDGRRVAGGCWDGTVRVWDTESGRELHCLSGHTQMVWSLEISRDMQRVVTGSRDGTVRVWDVASGNELRCLNGHEGGVTRAVISTDGRRIVSSSEDRTIRVWDAASGEQLRSLRGHKGHVVSMGRSGDGGNIVKGVIVAAISVNGLRIVTSSGDDTVRVWDAESGRELCCLRGHENSVTSLAISTDGRRIVSGSVDKTVRMWDADLREELYCMREHQDEVSSVAISTDGQLVVSGSYDKTVRVWDAETGKELHCWRGYSEVLDVAISSEGWIVAASLSGIVQVWDLESGQCVEIIQGCHDIQALVGGAVVFPFLATARGTETVVEDTGGRLMAALPVDLACLTTHPSGTRWVGTSRSQIYFIALEGVPDQTQI